MSKKQTDPMDQKQEAKDSVSSDMKQSETIVAELKKDLKLFKDDRGDAFARIKNKGHYENWPVATRNRSFRTWVAFKGRKVLGAAPSENAIKEAITALEGEAIFNSSEVCTLFNRVGIENAPEGKKYWYDLADEGWSAIEITEKGWKMISNPPIIFRRYQHQLPQIIPDYKDNNIRLLDKYLRLSNEEDRIIIYAFIITSIIADIPHVCLILHGVQGSSKTTLFKILRLLIDPSRLEAISMSTDQRSLILNLDQNWFCPFDNVSGIKRDISDIFCRVVTGAGFCDRTLFTDDTPFIRNIKRVIGLNGINVSAVQPDLLERSIIAELEAIDKKSRLSEEELWREFNSDKSKIFGGMLDVLSKAIVIKPNVVIDSRQRMADFMGWGEAIARAMDYPDGYFISAYNKNMEEINAQGVESDCVAATIRIMVEKKVEYEMERCLDKLVYPILVWDGTPADLIDELTSIAKDNKIIDDERDKYWPSKANAMSRHLNRIKPTLKSEGIILTTGQRTTSGRKITIKYKTPEDIDNTDNTDTKQNDPNSGIIKDGNYQVDTRQNIDMSSPTPPWLRETNNKQTGRHDDNVDNTKEIDVDSIPF